jgi:membrane protein DedA with SNARE-associated domain
MESIQYLEYLVRTYGYWALLAGTFLEGETILIIGGLLAKLGLLKLSTVMVIAFIGSFSGDQVYFYIGRFKGRELLKKHHKWEKRVDKIHKILERYHDLIMLGFRFVYGMRIMTPFVLGMSKQIKAIRFSILNAMGAVLWSVAISAGGYFFGYALEGFIKDVKKYEIHAVLAIFVIGAALWIVHKCIEKRTS